MPTPLDCLNRGVLDVIRSLQDAADPNILNDIIHLYLDTSRVLVEALLGASRGTSELDAMRITAHTLKGSSASIGAQRLADACHTVESIGRSGCTDGLERALITLQQEHEYACQALTAELSRKAA